MAVSLISPPFLSPPFCASRQETITRPQPCSEVCCPSSRERSLPPAFFSLGAEHHTHTHTHTHTPHVSHILAGKIISSPFLYFVSVRGLPAGCRRPPSLLPWGQTEGDSTICFSFDFLAILSCHSNFSKPFTKETQCFCMIFRTLANVGVSVIVLETAIKEEGRGAVARYAQHEGSRGRPRRRIHNSWSLMRCSRLTPKKPSYKLVEEIKLFCMARLGKDGVLFAGKQKRGAERLFFSSACMSPRNASLLYPPLLSAGGGAAFVSESLSIPRWDPRTKKKSKSCPCGMFGLVETNITHT